MNMDVLMWLCQCNQSDEQDCGFDIDLLPLYECMHIKVKPGKYVC